MTGDYAKRRKPVEDVPMRQALNCTKLFRHESDLIVLRHHAVTRVKSIGAVNDERYVQLLASLIEWKPIFFVHTGRRSAATRIGADVGGYEPKLVDAPVQF